MVSSYAEAQLIDALWRHILIQSHRNSLVPATPSASRLSDLAASQLSRLGECLVDTYALAQRIDARRSYTF